MLIPRGGFTLDDAWRDADAAKRKQLVSAGLGRGTKKIVGVF